MCGFHAVTGVLRQQADAVSEIYLDRARSDGRARALARFAGEHGVRVLLVEASRIDALVGDRHHQGVAARVAAGKPTGDLDTLLDALDEPALVLILDGVTDPHNLGACLRVADALRAHAVVAPRDRAVGLNATVSRVASGAAETVPFFPVTNLARAMRGLKDRGIWLVGADQDAAADIYSMRLDTPTAWVLGAEGEGMRRLTRESCDERVRIPMYGTVSSLNVSVAAAICLAETRRQRAAVPDRTSGRPGRPAEASRGGGG